MESDVRKSMIVENTYHMMKGMLQSAAESNQKSTFDGSFLIEDMKILNDHIRKQEISSTSYTLMEFLLLVEWRCDKNEPPLSDMAIYNSILRLEKVITKGSMWELVGDDENISPLDEITDFEVNVMEQTLSYYVSSSLSTVEKTALFFPLSDNFDGNTLVTWRIMEKLASVKVVPHITLYQRNLSAHLKNTVKKELNIWLQEHLEDIKLESKSLILEDLRSLTEAVENLNLELNQALKNFSLIESLFQSIECSYWDFIAECLEKKLIPLCQKAMKLFDDYQVKHKDFHVNIKESSAICHRFYLQLKQTIAFMLPLVKSNFVRLDLNALFGNSFLNLLYVYQIECHSRIKRAVEASEKDSLMEEKKIYSSTVIVLNCICMVLDEYKRLGIDDEEMQFAFLIKITDMICDGARIFSQEMSKRTTKLWLLSKETEISKRICAFGNSVDHLLQYLITLPDVMHWNEVLSIFGTDEITASYRLQVKRVLGLILDSVKSDLRLTQRYIYSKAVAQIAHFNERHLKNWLDDHVIRPAGSQNADRFLSCLHQQLEVIHNNLKEEDFQWFLGQLWINFLFFIKDNFIEGKTPDYGKVIKKNMEDVYKYFDEMKMNVEVDKKYLYPQVHQMVDLNSNTTLQLELSYFGQLADLLTSPTEYLGHMAFQTGYKKSGRGTVALYIKVRKCQRLPLRKFNVDSWTVKLEFRPKAMFPTVRAVKTKPVTDELINPIFDESFSFHNLPASVLTVEGSVMEAWLENQDGSYCANAVLRLSQVPNMSGWVSVDFLPVHVIALRQSDVVHPSFQVLEKRKKDRQAKRFVSSRYNRTKSSDTILSCIMSNAAVNRIHNRRSLKLPWRRSDENRRHDMT